MVCCTLKTLTEHLRKMKWWRGHIGLKLLAKFSLNSAKLMLKKKGSDSNIESLEIHILQNFENNILLVCKQV